MTSGTKRLVYTGLGAVGLSAAAGSGVGLWGLAAQVGYPIGLRWILWLSLDAYGLLAGLTWATAKAPGLRRRAATNTLLAIAAIFVGNCLHYALTYQHRPATVWVTVAVTSVPLTAVVLAFRTATLLTSENKERSS